MRNLQNPIKQLADLAPPTGDRYSRKLSVQEAARYYNVSKGWLDKRRVTGDGPRYMKIGRRVLMTCVILRNGLSANDDKIHLSSAQTKCSTLTLGPSH